MAYSGRQQSQNLPGATPAQGRTITQPGTYGRDLVPPPPPPPSGGLGGDGGVQPVNSPGGNRTNLSMVAGADLNASYSPGASLLAARQGYHANPSVTNALSRGFFNAVDADAPDFSQAHHSGIENPMTAAQEAALTPGQRLGNTLMQTSLGNVRAVNAPQGLGYGRSNALGAVRQWTLTGNEAFDNGLQYTQATPPPVAATPPPPPPVAAPTAPAAAPPPQDNRQSGGAPVPPPPGYQGIPGATVNTAGGQFDSGFGGPGKPGPTQGPRYEAPSSIRDVTGSALKGFTYQGKYTDVMKIPDAALKSYLLQNPQYLKAGWTVVNGQILRAY